MDNEAKQDQRPQADAVWYVQAAEKVWGPYLETRVEDFVAEGRVAPDTLVSNSPEGPFVAAARQARLMRLFSEPDTQTPVSAPIRTRARPAQPTPAPADAGSRALIVWADLKGGLDGRFETELAAHGPMARVAAGLWVVRAQTSPAHLRNSLSRILSSADSVMVIEAAIDQTAWFNLGHELDRSLRQLWHAQDA